MTREERLVDAARYALRVLSGQTHGQQDRISASRALHAALIDVYDDVEPSHVHDREAWQQRLANRLHRDEAAAARRRSA